MTRMNNQHRWIKLIAVLLLSLVIAACGEDEAVAKTDEKPINPEAPAIGTDIKDVVKTESAKATSGGIKTLTWDNLIPKGFEPELMMKKYKKQLDSIKDGTPEEQALIEKIVNEFNNAPSKTELDGVKVKIPGFIAPLEETNGMVGEFLLVPYFGSCIHAPPPPVNQTVLVKTKKDKSIPIEKIYDPVWVIGKVQVKRQDTDLAKAGYVIEEAELEVYED